MKDSGSARPADGGAAGTGRAPRGSPPPSDRRRRRGTPPCTNPCTHQISVHTQYSMSAVSSMYPASAACSSTEVVMVISGCEYCRSRPGEVGRVVQPPVDPQRGELRVGDAEVDVAVDDLVHRPRRRHLVGRHHVVDDALERLGLDPGGPLDDGQVEVPLTRRSPPRPGSSPVESTICFKVVASYPSAANSRVAPCSRISIQGSPIPWSLPFPSPAARPVTGEQTARATAESLIYGRFMPFLRCFTVFAFAMSWFGH